MQTLNDIATINQRAEKSALFSFMRVKTLDEFVPRSEYMERIGRSDDRMRDFDRRLSKVEEFGDKLQSMAISLQGMVVTLQSMQKEQAEQGERLKKIEEEPADNWRKFIWTAFACVVTGVVGYFLAKGGI